MTFARNNAVYDNIVYRTIMIRVKLALYPINSLVLFKYNGDIMLTEFLVLVSRYRSNEDLSTWILFDVKLQRCESF